MQQEFIDTIKDALDNFDMLTQWEADFIDDLAELEPSIKLSDNQKEILIKIQDKLDS